jgi:hypothetical protein
MRTETTLGHIRGMKGGFTRGMMPGSSQTRTHSHVLHALCRLVCAYSLILAVQGKGVAACQWGTRIKANCSLRFAPRPAPDLARGDILILIIKAPSPRSFPPPSRTPRASHPSRLSSPSALPRPHIGCAVLTTLGCAQLHAMKILALHAAQGQHCECGCPLR